MMPTDERGDGGSDDWQCEMQQIDQADWEIMIWIQLSQFTVSVTDSKAVSVEWPLLKPDWFLFSWLFFERQRLYLVENNSLKSFLYKWEEQDSSATVYK